MEASNPAEADDDSSDIVLFQHIITGQLGASTAVQSALSTGKKRFGSNPFIYLSFASLNELKQIVGRLIFIFQLIMWYLLNLSLPIH